MAGQLIDRTPAVSSSGLKGSYDNLPSNPPKKTDISNKSTGKPKGALVVEKKGFWKRLRDLLIEGTWSDVRKNLVEKVIGPAIKRTVSDALKDSVDIFVYGETKNRRSSSGINSGTVFNYSGISTERRRQEDIRALSRARSRGEAVTIKFETEEDAIAVRDRMQDCMDTYHEVTIQTLYSEAQIDSEFPESGYGWKSLADATIERCIEDGNERWLLIMPKPIKLPH